MVLLSRALLLRGFVPWIGKEMGLHNAVARLPTTLCVVSCVSLSHAYRAHTYGKPSYRYIIHDKTYRNIRC